MSVKEPEIESTIERIVTTYPFWTIGITDNPDCCKSENSNPKHWLQWRADDETIARDVEKYFLDKGMKGAFGGGRAS